jgi:hypothetical protein
VKQPVLATLALFVLAILFGWEARQALRATPGGQENAATPPAGSWQPGVSAPDPQPPPDPTPAAAAVTARPLFRADRQPFREQAASPVAARNYDSELSRFTLLGVFGFGGEPVGVVTAKTGNKTDRWELKAGDALSGFTVKEVGVEGLMLTADGREFHLPLYAGPPTAAAGAVRTEGHRREAATPAPGSPTAAKPAAPGASPGPAASPAPAPAQPRPAYMPPDRLPQGRPPRFITPGRR